MRIVAGEFKGFPLFSAKSSKVRPTADACKERIFSIIGSCQGKKVLDLFAGFGGLGLEAISRGAEFAQFVDASAASLSIVKKNIAKLQIASRCQLSQKKADAFLKKCQQKFELIFLDPPYDFGLVNDCLNLIAAQNLLAPSGVIVAEHSPKEKVESEDFAIFKTKKSGSTVLTFLEEKS